MAIEPNKALTSFRFKHAVKTIENHSTEIISENITYYAAIGEPVCRLKYANLLSVYMLLWFRGQIHDV